jgi:beta-glucanase (GH16 family)
MNRRIVLLFLLVTAGVASDVGAAGGWKLFWSDEFNANGFLDPANWWVRVARPGWVNGEQQAYTAGHDQANSNVFVKNGYLIIEARRHGDSITSGRIEGENLRNFMYGRMEARARLPVTKGMWPAFWMQGWDINKGAGWPAAGEIDIMEGKGRLPSWTSGAFHCSAGTPVKSGNYTLPAGTTNFHDAFHTFAVEWSQDSIRWYVDAVNFLTMTKEQVPTAPINKEYFFLVNVAVGGGFDGNIDNTTVFPESLIVDYVRVYHWDPTLSATTPGGLRNVSRAVQMDDAGGFVTISLPFEQSYACEVVSIAGKKAIFVDGRGASIRFSTAGLAPGIYFARVTGKRESCIRRFAVGGMRLAGK